MTMEPCCNSAVSLSILRNVPTPLLDNVLDSSPSSSFDWATDGPLINNWDGNCGSMFSYKNYKLNFKLHPLITRTVLGKF